ncbi:MAG: DNA topoisomerase VI subunit B [Nanopusillaceae archaeon]
MANNALKESIELYKNFKRVSIAEFFEKNRHLLGFENLRKALLIGVKELVDNSLDACEEAKILPDIYIEIERINKEIYRITVEDNGPGIPYDKVPEVFGSFLYGSKFHRYVSTRGKQGIGAAAIVLYSQLTTRKPATIITKTLNADKAILHKIKIDIKTNSPIVEERKYIGWKKEHGTSVTVYLQAQYVKGKQSVDSYIELVALANPHAKITYVNPDGEIIEYKRISKNVPELKEAKPHPHGIEIGTFERMIKDTKYNNVISFLMEEFYGIGTKIAEEILKKAKLSGNEDPRSLSFEDIENLYNALQSTKIRALPSKYITLLGRENIIKSLTYLYDPDFVTAYVRKPAVYRGNTFIVEVGLAYGGNITEFNIYRYANRVPLLYKPGECAITHAISEINFKKYGFTVEEGKVKDPVVILVHVASVWLPFTSESKEAIAPYPEIVKEIELAVKKVLRETELFIKKKRSIESIGEKYKSLYGYGLELSKYLSKIINIEEEKVKEKIINRIKKELHQDIEEIIKSVKEIRKFIRDGKIDESKKLIKRILKDVIKLKIIDENEVEKISEEIINNIKREKLLEFEE